MIGRLLRVPATKFRNVPTSLPPTLEQLYPDDGSDSDPEKSLDLDKSWHLIHFLLTGLAWGGDGPIANAILGGEELVGTDAGYGPFRCLNPDQVRETFEALDALDAGELWRRFDADRVNAAEIYPTPWTGEDPESEYITQNYDALRAFYSAAASAKDGMLLFIS
jgi:hypothetical protein